MIVVLQGRVRSTRLPGKGFFTFFGQTIWERMCSIALAITGVEQVIFATGNLDENRLIEPFVTAQGVRFFAGSEDDLLERFSHAIESTTAEYVVRLTCDNYLAQPEVVEGLLGAVSTAGADYGFVEPLSHYAGEVVRRSTLLDAHASGLSTAMAREHVTWDIRRSAAVKKMALPCDYLGLDHARSVTLDTIDDLIQLKTLERTQPLLRPVRCLAALRSATIQGLEDPRERLQSRARNRLA